MTCWCPCITFGRIAEIVDRGSTCKFLLLYIANSSVLFVLIRPRMIGTKACGTSGSVYMMMMCLMGCPWIYSCSYRTKLRGQYALAEGPCSDCCVHCCCGPCSLCQEYRQLSNQGFVMSIGIFTLLSLVHLILILLSLLAFTVLRNSIQYTGWHGNEELKTRRPSLVAPTVEGEMDR